MEKFGSGIRDKHPGSATLGAYRTCSEEAEMVYKKPEDDGGQGDLHQDAHTLHLQAITVVK
jgi:hypothetical protein